MTKSELEKRVAELESRIAVLEARPVYVPQPYWVPYPYRYGQYEGPWWGVNPPPRYSGIAYTVSTTSGNSATLG